MFDPDSGNKSRDLLVKVKGALVAPYPLCHPNQYRRSLERVANSTIKTLFCAHVPPVNKSDIPFDEIICAAPTTPKNHWRSMTPPPKNY